MKLSRLHLAVLSMLLAAASLWALKPALQKAIAAVRPASKMAALVPQGALLTIESPDFQALLGAWNASPEQAAWLKSANYSVFSRSRLFGRLSDAQGEFWAAAGLPSELDLLKEVAGTQSIFAWYDIGNLEFVYVTRMPAERMTRTTLMQMRGKFSRRMVGDTPFYVKTDTAPDASHPRTVAFASSGDWLLLATREDLIVQSLKLIQKTSTDSVATEPWFEYAEEAAKTSGVPDLHMVLNLDRLVPTAYFRSYWVQRNVSEMKGLSAAVADLYREPGHFREERMLIPKPSTVTPDAETLVNLDTLASLVPERIGTFEAVSTQDAAAAYAAIDDKLLTRSIGNAPVGTDAPAVDLTPVAAGSVSDLETRIDALDNPVTQTGRVAALQRVIAGAGLEARLTVGSAGQAGENAASVWIPFHAAVVLRASRPWDQAALEAALQEDLRGRLTAAHLGLEWHAANNGGQLYQALAGPKPLQLAVEGNLCILTDDPALMVALLTGLHAPHPKPDTSVSSATLIAGFDHTSQGAAYTRLTTLLDRGGATAEPAQDAEPAFFSGNLGSLSGSFAALERERFVESRSGANLHQTITYEWKR